MDRQVKYSILRIYEMEKRLETLERELEEFIGGHTARSCSGLAERAKSKKN
jgi:hypothetical protein